MQVPEPRARTLDALHRALEAAQDATPRAYLGASQIGHKCDRYLWLSMRWAARRTLPASAIRAIEDGHQGEAVMAARLRMIPGIELHTDNQDGAQFSVSACGGHLRGHMDGAILGVLEAPLTWHVWEHKQVNETKFKKLQKLVDEVGEKNALAKWDEVYHGQAIVYMGLSGMKRHFLTVGTPGGRDYVTVRTEADQSAFELLLERAERIITARVPPARINDDPAWFECKWCPMHALCHGTAAPEVNCRTCAYATPKLDGDARWHCERHDHDMALDNQRQGCPKHRVIPILLERFAEPIDATDDTVTYRNKATGAEFVNGEGEDCVTSAEIHALADKSQLGQERIPGTDAYVIRKEFKGARYVA